MIPPDLAKHWSCFPWSGKEHQEKRKPHAACLQPNPDPELQPLPFIPRPTWVTLGLVFKAQMGLSESGLELSLQMLGVREGWQVKLRAQFISSRLKAEKTSPAALSRALSPPRAQ